MRVGREGNKKRTRKEQEENQRLRAELEKKDSGLAQSHHDLEAKLALQQEQFLVANKSIRSHLGIFLIFSLFSRSFDSFFLSFYLSL